METVCDFQDFQKEPFEEVKFETCYFNNQHSNLFESFEQPKLQKFYSFGDVYDTNSNLSTHYTRASSPNLPEVKLNKLHSFGMNLPSTKSAFSFADTRGSTPKTPQLIDLEIENLE